MELNLLSFIIYSLNILTISTNFVYSSALSIDKEVKEANLTVKWNITEVKEPDSEEKEKVEEGDEIKITKDDREITTSHGIDTDKLREESLSKLAQLPELDPCMQPKQCHKNYWPWCEVLNGTVRCICILKYYRSPPICKQTCTLHSECNADEICIFNRCRDLCPGPCAPNALCDVIDHKPHCSCPPGYSGNPFISCQNMHPEPPPISTPCMPSPCAPNSQCKEENGTAVCKCLPNSNGSPPSCTQKCTNKTECHEFLACINNQCRDPCPICGPDAQCHVHDHVPYCSCLSKPGHHSPATVDCQVIREAMDPTFGYKQYPIMGPKFDPIKGAPWLGLKTEIDFQEWRNKNSWPYNIPPAPYCVNDCVLPIFVGSFCPGSARLNGECAKIDA